MSGEVALYKDASLTGKSLTLRIRRCWVEQGHWGPKMRSQSTMILSVPVRMLDDFSDDPNDLSTYETKCAEAEELFNNVRREYFSRSKVA